MLKQSRFLSVLVIVLVSAFFMLSTLAMYPIQEIATVTPEASLTSTATQTPTSTQTSSPTPLPSATPTYSIPAPLQTEIANANEKLDDLKQNPLATHGSSILDNILAEAILWVGGLFFGKKAVKVKIDQDKLDGKAVNKTLEDINIVLGYLFKISFWFLVLLLIIWAMFTFGKPLTTSTSQLDLPSNSINSNQIETQNGNIPQPTPSGFPEKEAELQYSLYFSLGISLVIILIFFSITGIISRNQIKKYESTFPKLDLEIVGRKLLPAIFLVLILIILPDPVEAFLSPIIIPYLLFAFFDVVLLYSNSHLQDIVVRHYPKIIFLSVFGVWFRVFQLLQNYLRPFWNVSAGYLQNTLAEYLRSRTPSFGSSIFWQQFPYTSVEFLWELLPITLAILYAISPSRKLRKISEEQYIRKMSRAGEREDEQA